MILWLGIKRERDNDGDHRGRKERMVIKRSEGIESVKGNERKEILEEEEFYGGGKGTKRDPRRKRKREDDQEGIGIIKREKGSLIKEDIGRRRRSHWRGGRFF